MSMTGLPPVSADAGMAFRMAAMAIIPNGMLM